MDGDDPAAPVACPNVHGLIEELRSGWATCVVRNGAVVFDANPSLEGDVAVRCDGSLPWHAQSALDAIGGACYNTQYETSEGAQQLRICVHGEGSGLCPTADALRSMPRVQPTTKDAPTPDVRGEFRKCYEHALEGRENATVAVHTTDRTTCELAVSEARKQCALGDEGCVTMAYSDEAEKEYTCAAPTELRLGHGDGWARWVRSDDGRAEYLAPTPCDDEGSFCGAVEGDKETLYTGVCQTYVLNDDERRGCRAFASQEDVAGRRREAEFRTDPATNFNAERQPWESLALCTDTVTIDGFEVCRSTRSAVVRTTTLARNAEDAAKRCDRRACADRDPTCGVGIVEAVPKSL